MGEKCKIMIFHTSHYLKKSKWLHEKSMDGGQQRTNRGAGARPFLSTDWLQTLFCVRRLRDSYRNISEISKYQQSGLSNNFLGNTTKHFYFYFLIMGSKLSFVFSKSLNLTRKGLNLTKWHESLHFSYIFGLMTLLVLKLDP